MKKILVFLLFCTVISFSQETSDTIQIDSTVISNEISQNPDTITTENISESKDSTTAAISSEIPDTAQTEETDSLQDSTEILEKEQTALDTIVNLTIITNPDNASILINRKRAGNSPFTTTLQNSEEYNIMILKDGFELFDETLILSGKANDTLLIDLIPENANETVAVVADTVENIESDSTDISSDTTQTGLSDEEAAKKKKKANRIGIIAFLVVMFSVIFLQEYNNR